MSAPPAKRQKREYHEGDPDLVDWLVELIQRGVEDADEDWQSCVDELLGPRTDVAALRTSSGKDILAALLEDIPIFSDQTVFDWLREHDFFDDYTPEVHPLQRVVRRFSSDFKLNGDGPAQEHFAVLVSLICSCVDAPTDEEECKSLLLTAVCSGCRDIFEGLIDQAFDVPTGAWDSLLKAALATKNLGMVKEITDRRSADDISDELVEAARRTGDETLIKLVEEKAAETV